MVKEWEQFYKALFDVVERNNGENTEDDTEDAAKDLYALYRSFNMAGFTEAQAFELIKLMLEKAVG